MSSLRNGRPNADKEAEISADMVRELFGYDPATGVLTINTQRGGKKVGDIAGCKRSDGYIITAIRNRLIFAHRVAWCHYYGEWPKQLIDHINMDRSDNRIANLRDCSKSYNNANTGPRRNNTSGYKGVVQKGPNLWIAQIRAFNKVRGLGYFDDPLKAKAAYDKAAQEAFGEFARSA